MLKIYSEIRYVIERKKHQNSNEKFKYFNTYCEFQRDIEELHPKSTLTHWLSIIFKEMSGNSNS